MKKIFKKNFIPFILPALLVYIFVVIIPFVTGVLYSFSAWKGSYFEGGNNWREAFVGFDNYIRTFSSQEFKDATVYSIQYTIVALITINLVSLGLALLVHSIQRGAGFFRTTFFIPNLLSGLALGYVWLFIFEVVFSKFLFGPNGLINAEFLTYMTQNRTKTLFAIVILMIWQSAGYHMLIYISGLNSIPGEYYEAAKVDGASVFQRFRHITLPLLMPSITINLFLVLSNSFKLLDPNVALTEGDFNTRLLTLQIVKTTETTTPPDYGMAQAEAVIFFLIIALVSVTQVILTKRREVEL